MRFPYTGECHSILTHRAPQQFQDFHDLTIGSQISETRTDSELNISAMLSVGVNVKAWVPIDIQRRQSLCLVFLYARLLRLVPFPKAKASPVAYCTQSHTG